MKERNTTMNYKGREVLSILGLLSSHKQVFKLCHVNFVRTGNLDNLSEYVHGSLKNTSQIQFIQFFEFFKWFQF